MQKKKMSVSYCFKPAKFIRDIPHGYVNITSFDIDLIDTIQFQRLKDIKQLTCQQVYPSAQHTRFEHSLGVLELTRQAIKNLNKNGFISQKLSGNAEIIDKQLQFNAAIAALLHDVGHCPYSHLGETEFSKDEVRKALYHSILAVDDLMGTDLYKKVRANSYFLKGSVHEQLSCLMILEKLSEPIEDACNKAAIYAETHPDCESCDLSVDYELIIRSILGIEYTKDETDPTNEYLRKNAIIKLINSSIIDMDKLDYIMRDSTLTGIGVPTIDTSRLFRNMYFTNTYQYVFTSKAVPVLQNMIDARDSLYMYVYNHQTAVFSDFMNTYILRKVARNVDKFISILYPRASKRCLSIVQDSIQIMCLALVPKSYLFSVDAVIEENRSDSDWTSLLNILYTCGLPDFLRANTKVIELQKAGEQELNIQEIIRLNLYGEAAEELGSAEKANKMMHAKEDAVQELVDDIQQTFRLIQSYKKRQFLKPWWKTLFEFSSFMNQNFPDDKIRINLCGMICKGGAQGRVTAIKFRSQIAKHIIFITRKLSEEYSYVPPLDDGDFFIVERPTRFFDPDTIKNIDIAVKANKFYADMPSENSTEYYVKSLTNIIPQKDYSSIYDKESFYVYSKPLPEDDLQENIQKKYKILEDIFVFVAAGLASINEEDLSKIIEDDTQSKQDMAGKFKNQYML